MKKRHLIGFSILAGLGTSTALAQARTPAPIRGQAAPATAPAAVAPTANPAPLPPLPAKEEPIIPREPKSPRAFSSDVSAAISAGMPKFNPQPKPAPKPVEELADLRETDKPKNQIIRLPEVMVREPRNPVLTERAVHTAEGLTALAERRYITDSDRALNRSILPLFGVSTEARAMAMYAEDERLRNMADLEEAAGLVSATDKAAGAYIKREAQKTYQRTSDFGWRGASGREDRGINDAATAPRER